MTKYGGGIANGRDWTSGKFTKGWSGRPRGAKNKRTIERANDRADFEKDPQGFMLRMKEKAPIAYAIAVSSALSDLARIRFDETIYVVGDNGDWPTELSAALKKALDFAYMRASRWLKATTGADIGEGVVVFMTAVEEARSKIQAAEVQATHPAAPPSHSPTSFEARYGFSERELNNTIELPEYDPLK